MGMVMTRKALFVSAAFALVTALAGCQPHMEPEAATSTDPFPESALFGAAWTPVLSAPRPSPAAVAMAAPPAAAAPSGFGFAPARLFPGELPSDNVRIHSGITAGDFNGDGRDDVAAFVDGDAVGLYLQGQAGITGLTFTQGVNLGSQRVFVVNDFNEDGIDDVATLLASGGVGIFLSQGKGKLPVYEVGYPGHVVTATDIVHDWATLDINGDGHQDIVASQTYCGNYDLCPGYDVLFGNGQGTFSRGTLVRIASTYHLTTLHADDLNADGRMDLIMQTQAFSGYPEGAPYTENFVVYAKPGGGMEAPRLVGTNSGFASLAFGDINGDGRRDMLMFRDIRYRLADGRYSGPHSLAGYLASPADAVLADFDGDGFTDAVSHQFEATYPPTLPFFIVYLQREGVLTPALRIVDPRVRFGFQVDPLESPYAVGDFNSDGCKDLAVSVGYDGLAILDGQRCSRIPTGGNQAPRRVKG